MPDTVLCTTSQTFRNAHFHDVRQGSAVVGDTCSGKTETVRGLAALLGKYLNLTSCSDSTELSSLSRKLQVITMFSRWMLAIELFALCSLCVTTRMMIF